MYKDTIRQLKKQGVDMKTAKSNVFDVLNFLTSTELANSKSEAKRLIEQGGITINGKKIDKTNSLISLVTGDIIKRGKFIFLSVLDSKDGFLEFSTTSIKSGIIHGRL